MCLHVSFLLSRGSDSQSLHKLKHCEADYILDIADGRYQYVADKAYWTRPPNFPESRKSLKQLFNIYLLISTFGQQKNLIIMCWGLKVVPLKLFYYQTFFESWHNQHSWYEQLKNSIKRWGHRASLRVSRLLNWGIFTGCAIKIWNPFLQN